MAGSVSIVLVVAVAVLVPIILLIRKGRVERAGLATKLEAIEAMPLELAKRESSVLLGDPTRFRCVVAQIDGSRAANSLPPLLTEFFESFDSVLSLSGERARIDRSLVSSHAKPGFVVVGRGMEGTDTEYELGIRDAEDRIYVLYPNEPVDPKFGSYSSIYHWVVAAARGH